jgi:hypothetical protein
MQKKTPPGSNNGVFISTERDYFLAFGGVGCYTHAADKDFSDKNEDRMTQNASFLRFLGLFREDYIQNEDHNGYRADRGGTCRSG